VTSCVVCTVQKEMRSAGFLVEPQNQGQRFGDLGQRITTTVSCLGLKTKSTSVCRLHHKTDGRRLTRDTHRDLAAYFTWKKVRIEFPSLTSTLVEARLLVMHVPSSQRSCGVEAEDGRVDATGWIRFFYPNISVLAVLSSRAFLSF
jgi:hypothetical protein